MTKDNVGKILAVAAELPVIRTGHRQLGFDDRLQGAVHRASQAVVEPDATQLAILTKTLTLEDLFIDEEIQTLYVVHVVKLFAKVAKLPIAKVPDYFVEHIVATAAEGGCLETLERLIQDADRIVA